MYSGVNRQAFHHHHLKSADAATLILLTEIVLSSAELIGVKYNQASSIVSSALSLLAGESSQATRFIKYIVCEFDRLNYQHGCHDTKSIAGIWYIIAIIGSSPFPLGNDMRG